ncbi:4-hydroxy-tetrahydrodipicolinate reductase [Agreia sp. COWG]|uniref:4-hydroxy-tetrahydrodipicolinate reductase n=1 Tax=Agreia sp. COWG TaxID=2773266 RepID=UPI0019295690|nr:4-hydroxy-tetrahydrodipicolinate reductase [Agreia sp. COWG]CAD5999767.1 4-hydroxy-tetrahydrodipicolinate reductase [Agreia sp. COWG]
MSIKVAVVGASGRMGRLVCRIVDETPGFELMVGIGSQGELSQMIGADLVVDVTIPAVSRTVVDSALENGIPVLVGTSGWSSDRLSALERRLALSPELGVVVIPNFSVGSVLATSFAAMAARFFDSIEIVEAHHSTKIDSPSGTAVRTAELITAARAELGPVAAPHIDQRARGQQVASVPIHSLRLQGVVAKQEVLLGSTGEVLTISHETIDQSAYEAGIVIALRAAVTTRGLVVGLDRLIDLDGSAAGRESTLPPVSDEPSGQAATATSTL